MADQPRDHNELHAQHTPEAIRLRLARGPKSSYLRDFVYGAIDGAVTTFAVVAGVQGAGLDPSIVLILGVANLFADGFSMAASNFLGSRAQQQEYDRTVRTEADEIDRHPEGEREEIRQIFRAKGFDGDTLEQVVEVITADRDRWIATMLAEEHGLQVERASPTRAAWSTFIAFVIVGAIPLVPFVAAAMGAMSQSTAFALSAPATGVAFIGVGALKARFVQVRWWVSGLETLLIGGVAAALAYAVGLGLSGLAP